MTGGRRRSGSRGWRDKRERKAYNPYQHVRGAQLAGASRHRPHEHVPFQTDERVVCSVCWVELD